MNRPQDRRQFGRRLAFKPVTIAQADGRRLTGTVLDSSEAGAMIRIAKHELVEKEFYLEIPEDDFVVKCRVIHADGPSIGVQYIKAPRRLSWQSK